MKNAALLIFAIVFLFSTVACSDSSYISSDEEYDRYVTNNESEALEANAAYSDGVHYAIYQFEGMLEPFSGAYVDVSQLIDIIYAQYGDELGEEIVDCIVFHPDLDVIDFADHLDKQLNHLSEEFN